MQLLSCCWRRLAQLAELARENAKKREEREAKRIRPSDKQQMQEQKEHDIQEYKDAVETRPDSAQHSTVLRVATRFFVTQNSGIHSQRIPSLDSWNPHSQAEFHFKPPLHESSEVRKTWSNSLGKKPCTNAAPAPGKAPSVRSCA